MDYKDCCKRLDEIIAYKEQKYNACLYPTRRDAPCICGLCVLGLGRRGFMTVMKNHPKGLNQAVIRRVIILSDKFKRLRKELTPWLFGLHIKNALYL